MSFIIGDSSKYPFKNSKLQPKYSTLQPILVSNVPVIPSQVHALPTYKLDRSFFMQIYKIMPIPKDTKKVTHKDYQTRQWPMLQPFPARTEKLERHIVLEKGFRKIQKTTCDFNIHFKNF